MGLKLLAVSGGIDSMVMLDFLAREHADEEFLVVSVDHGTRDSAAADAEFVLRVARERYGLPAVCVRLGLGEGVSEARAREARYAALMELGRQRGAADFEIWTAQHLDDLVESVAINCLRGTGWRGLAAMGRAGVRRPFLESEFFESGFFEGPVDKRWILRYAAENGVLWREDPTNQSDDYLRNRIRPLLRSLPRESKLKIYKLWKSQQDLRVEIDAVVAGILAGQDDLTREWFYGMADAVADEILRGWLVDFGITTTRLQRADFLKATREYRAGKLFNLPGDRMAKIGQRISLHDQFSVR